MTDAACEYSVKLRSMARRMLSVWRLPMLLMIVSSLPLMALARPLALSAVVPVGAVSVPVPIDVNRASVRPWMSVAVAWIVLAVPWVVPTVLMTVASLVVMYVVSVWIAVNAVCTPPTRVLRLFTLAWDETGVYPCGLSVVTALGSVGKWLSISVFAWAVRQSSFSASCPPRTMASSWATPYTAAAMIVAGANSTLSGMPEATALAAAATWVAAHDE